MKFSNIENRGKLSMVRALTEVGGFFIFIGRIFYASIELKANYGPAIKQTVSITYRSLTTVLFAGFFVGAILVLQFDLILSQYDSKIFLGGLNTSAMIRQVGPLIISFLLAGKIGAFTTAELGTMRVTDQIDAIECLGANSLQYLVLPRFWGIVFSSVLLLGIGLFISIMGSMLIADIFSGINPLQYTSSIGRFVTAKTFLSCLIQSVIYSIIVAGVSCYKGFFVKGGALGVGKAVTESAVMINLYVVISNFLISTIDLLLIEPWWNG